MVNSPGGGATRYPGAHMLRLVGFFLLAFLLASLLGHLPLIGPLFARTGLLGILLTAGLLSAVLTSAGARLLGARKLRSEVRTLAMVGSAYNHGKIGAAYLARGRARAALSYLEDAVRGEPEIAEWHYRLGLARLATRDARGALAALEGCLALEEEHAYGQAQMRRAECLLRLARPEDSLASLEAFERNHGPSPEACFRRGQTLRALGRKAEARKAFAEVGPLARQATRYQRREAGWWAMRATLARMI